MERGEFPGERAEAKKQSVPFFRGHRDEHPLVPLAPGLPQPGLPLPQAASDLTEEQHNLSMTSCCFPWARV
jgi:hypothetical protein